MADEESTPYLLRLEDILAMTQEQRDELIRQADTDPKIKLAFVKAMSGKSIADIKRVDNKRGQPYYTPKHAQEAQKAMDYMMETNTQVEFPYALRPKINPRTFQQRMMQACSYVEDHLDPSGKYRKFRNKFTVNMGAEAIQFVFVENSEEPLEFRIVKEVMDFEDVMSAVKKFCIEGELDTKIELPRANMLPILLKPEEIVIIEQFLVSYEDTRGLITPTKLVIFKAKESGAA